MTTFDIVDLKGGGCVAPRPFKSRNAAINAADKLNDGVGCNRFKDARYVVVSINEAGEATVDERHL